MCASVYYYHIDIFVCCLYLEDLLLGGQARRTHGLLRLHTHITYTTPTRQPLFTFHTTTRSTYFFIEHPERKVAHDKS
jgi:hypothetical protein